jgi:anaerobic selenocysteine-containing dehydrogenase
VVSGRLYTGHADGTMTVRDFDGFYESCKNTILAVKEAALAGAGESDQRLVEELADLCPNWYGVRYPRLEEEGIQWPCPDEDHPGSQFLHARLWEEDRDKRGPRAPFSVTPFEPPVDELTEEFPLRLTTGRRLDSYNTGVQTGGYTSPLRRGETIEIEELRIDPKQVDRRAAQLPDRPRDGEVAARDRPGPDLGLTRPPRDTAP